MADSPSAPFSLDFQPGISRDGTNFDSSRWLDCLWARWRLGRPRKMGGFSNAFAGLKGVPRRIHMFYDGTNIIAHIGTTNSIQQVIINAATGAFVSTADRTPAGFAASIYNGFTMDAIFDTTSQAVQLLVHYTQDTRFLSNPVPTLPLIGIINAQTPLAGLVQPGNLFGGTYAAPFVSGGIVCSQPYAWAFDTAGKVSWSAPNLPNYLGVVGGTSGAGTARISAQKIVQGIALRGGGVNSPAALFWTLSELISATFIGGVPVWAFNTVSPSASILSSDSVVEYDGLYFWAAVGRFMVYNGTVVELPNTQNQDWFFDNLNWQYAARCQAFKIPQYGEIWFCAPLFGNTECSHAVIYNVRENCWYDTVLPNGGRSCGYFAQGLRYPIMCGSTANANGLWDMWLHENGTDQVNADNSVAPIRSYVETGWLGGPKNTPPSDDGLSIQQLEPDIIQTGDLSTWLVYAPNARANTNVTNALPIRFTPMTPQEQLVSFNETSRLFKLHIESNVIGGSYILGRNLLHGQTSDARRVS